MGDDFFLEDLSNIKKKKKKVHSGRKGKRGERGLVEVLTQRFNLPFSRVVGSGNRWAQAKLTQEAKNVLTGDIVCPSEFTFAIECKYGYDDIDLFNMIESGNKELDEFLNQAEAAGEAKKKLPMLCWKKAYLPWLVFVPSCALSGKYQVCLHYREWIAVSLKSLLELPDSFFLQR